MSSGGLDDILQSPCGVSGVASDLNSRFVCAGALEEIEDEGGEEETQRGPSATAAAAQAAAEASKTAEREADASTAEVEALSHVRTGGKPKPRSRTR